jgi:hypothetical protein
LRRAKPAQKLPVDDVGRAGLLGARAEIVGRDKPGNRRLEALDSSDRMELSRGLKFDTDSHLKHGAQST